MNARGDIDPVYSLAVLSPERIAVGHASGALFVRDIATGAVTGTLVGHTDHVCALVVLPRGRLASASWDHSVRLWRADTGECLSTLLGHTSYVSSLALLRGGQLASGSIDSSVRVWDTDTGACTAVLAHESGVYSLAALSSGGVAAGCYDGTIALWGVDRAREGTLGGGAGFGEVLSLALLPDSRLAAGYGDRGDYSVRVWDVQQDHCDAVLTGHTLWVSSLAVLPDGRLLSGSWDKTIKVWDERALSVRGGAATDECAATLAHGGEVFALTVLPNGSVASGGGGYQDGTVRFWV